MTKAVLFLALGGFKAIISEVRKMISLLADGFCKICSCSLSG